MKRPEGFDSQKPEPPVPARKRAPKTPRAKPVAGEPSDRVPRTEPKQSGRAQSGRALSGRAQAAQAKRPQARQASGEPDSSHQLRNVARDRRRFEREEIRRFTRRTRHRRFSWIVAIGTILVLLGTVAIAVYSPLLALTKIEVSGASSLNPATIHDAVEGQLGTPLALLDSDRLTEELAEFTLIQSYVTEIVPPHTLIIRITERMPVATIATASGFTVVDPAGVVIDKTELRPPGVPTIELAGADTDSEVFDAVVEVLLALPTSLLAQVDRVTAETKDDITLVFAGVGQRVVWGSVERSELKARVLATMMAGQSANAQIEYDVSAPLNVVIRPIS